METPAKQHRQEEPAFCSLENINEQTGPFRLMLFTPRSAEAFVRSGILQHELEAVTETQVIKLIKERDKSKTVAPELIKIRMDRADDTRQRKILILKK